MSTTLFSPYSLGALELKNRLVMAPMTRCRALGGVPNALMAEYYAQRAGLGLLITEGTAPSANGSGYARIPGLYSAEQVEGWKLTTQAVKAKGAKIFAQLMHVGRVANQLNMPEGAEVVSASDLLLEGEIWTDAQGQQPHSQPRAMTQADIQQAIAEFVQAAKNAIEAGFDGVELHGANGYLIEQFLTENTNTRQDEYGGSETNRARFALEVTKAVVEAIGADKVGIRLSPYGVYNGVKPYGESLAWYLTEQLSALNLAYLHVVNHSSMGAPEVPAACIEGMRERFKGAFILSGGYFDAQSAEADLVAGKGDLVAFGRAALANPDLVERLQQGAALNEIDFGSFYTADEKGYTDYPALALAQ